MPDSACGEIELPTVGRVAVIASASGLLRVEFLDDSSPSVTHAGAGKPAAVRDRALAELAAYPAGGPLTCPVDLSTLTPFRQHVLRLLRRVPRGSTISYGELAARSGSPRAARAVGSACANNPVPVWIPCHRVLAGGGRLGGFSGGLSIKRALLAIEDVQIV